MRLTGRRAAHLLRVLGVEEGRTLRAGVLGEGIGRARVVAVEPAAVTVALEGIGGQPDPAATGPPVDLILALPRPKALRRILRLVAAMGLRRLHLVNAWRVEKSYFSSPVLEPGSVERELLLGAEQGGTARLPGVVVERLFVPFLERLEEEAAGVRRVAHPGGEPVGRTSLEPGGETLLAIGPEGGWIAEELGSFDRAGFEQVSLGPWILPTEAAVTAALAQLHLLNELPR